MRSWLPALLVFVAVVGRAAGQEGASAADPDSARRAALELAGAFANDGFRLRDGYMAGEIEPGKPVVAEVNLFRGNAYWFVAAVEKPGRRVAVSLHGADGRPLEFETHAEGAAAAAGIEPAASGPAFVRIELIEGGKAPFCLVYSYK
ncbi:MAG: hypothetical protein N2322_01305 [Terrimicrobiaceae bacterium]|nr:hypothetical protein [Terrimicrobiaceae bacterium]